jgi:hypothetical protein
METFLGGLFAVSLGLACLGFILMLALIWVAIVRAWTNDGKGRK